MPYLWTLEGDFGFPASKFSGAYSQPSSIYKQKHTQTLGFDLSLPDFLRPSKITKYAQAGAQLTSMVPVVGAPVSGALSQVSAASNAVWSAYRAPKAGPTDSPSNPQVIYKEPPPPEKKTDWKPFALIGGIAAVAMVAMS